MCTRVWVDAERALIESQGEFAAYLGVHLSDLAINGSYEGQARDENACLCPIDVTKMLDAAGKRWQFDEDDPLDVIVI